MIQNTQIVYAKPPADGALPDPAGTFNVVHTPLDAEALNLKAGEVLVENHYLSIDPYHRFGLYDPAVTRSQFPATKPGTVISTYGVSRVVRSANPEFAVGDLLYSWVRWERFTVVDEPNLQYLQYGGPLCQDTGMGFSYPRDSVRSAINGNRRCVVPKAARDT